MLTLELLDQSSRHFTRYRRIIDAVNAHIDMAIFLSEIYSVSECQTENDGIIAIFLQNCLPWQRPLRYREKRSRLIIYTQNAFIQ